MLLAKRDRSVPYDQQAKFIQDRISNAEKNFGELCNIFGEYSRKAGRVRDKSDEIAKLVMNYAETEDVNKTLCNGLANFAYCISILGDYGDLRVKHIETKVISELSQYDAFCRNAKEEVKHIFVARDREVSRRRYLNQVRERNPKNRQQITQAETDLLKAAADMSRTIHSLEEQTNAFEKRKLHDIKGVLLQFITIEMAFHAKALEVLTKAYQEVNEIDEDSDLQDYRKSLRQLDTIPHFTDKWNVFKSSDSKRSHSLGSLSSVPQKQKAGSKRLTKSQHVAKSNETLDSINVDNLPSAESAAEESESENSTVSEVTNKFLARKHRLQRK